VFRAKGFRPGGCLAFLARVPFVGIGPSAASLLAGVGWIACFGLFPAVLCGLARLDPVPDGVLLTLLFLLLRPFGLPCLYFIFLPLIRLLPRTLRPPRILHELLSLFALL